MAYSPIEQAYLDKVINTLAPDVEPEPEQMLASSGQVTSDAPGIVPIPQTRFEKIAEQTGMTLEQIGNELDKLGKVSIGGIELGIRDFLPFVGSIEDGKVTGTPAALQAVGRGESLITGTGMTTQLKPDAKLMALDVATAGVAKPAVSAAKATVKGVAKALPKDLPVGMSIKDVGKGVDDLGFYSAASKAIDAIQQPKGTGAQFLAQIEKTPGVKKEELLWTGLDDFLKGKKSVTKAEVQEYLNANRVEVKEVQLGDLKFNTQSEYALPEVVDLLKKEQGTSYENMRLVLENDYNAYQALAKKFPNLEDTDNWSDRVLAELIDTNSGAARFEKFTLPGGKNYREIYLTLPSKQSEDAIAQELYGVPFDKLMGRARADVVNKIRENQYIVPRAHSASPEADVNRLAQLRINDRVDADGKKVLFVEEIQSDWHQTGRKSGYAEDINKQLESINKERTALINEKLRLEKLAEPYTSKGQDAPSDILDKWNMASNKLNALQTKQNKLGQGVPDAPFKTSWHELALKRAIQLASEGGYDRIAFTTGKTQAERYDLSKQIETLRAEKIRGGTKAGQYEISAIDKNGKPSMYTVVPENELDGLIGKDLAKKVIDDADNYPDGKDYSGLDLQVGGEGMKGFYDTILPKYLDKYGKKWDAKTGMTEIPTEKTRDASGMPSMYPGKASVHYMDITPKMKESVLTKGQPLFQMAPAIPAGAAATQMQEENK